MMFPKTKNQYGEFELQYSSDCTFVLYKIMKDGTKVNIIDASCLFCDVTDEDFDGLHIDKSNLYLAEEFEERPDYIYKLIKSV